MRYLLDTCALIWLGMGGGDLSADARRRISVASALHYSPISVWEITRLMKEGKVIIPNDAACFVADLKELGLLKKIEPLTLISTEIQPTESSLQLRLPMI